MILLQVLTPWKFISNSDGDFLKPALDDDYFLNTWSDVTGQLTQNLLPEPNLYIIEAKVEEEVFSAIQADPAYFILWSKQVK